MHQKYFRNKNACLHEKNMQGAGYHNVLYFYIIPETRIMRVSESLVIANSFFSRKG